jgi:hypothetical protein
VFDVELETAVVLNEYWMPKKAYRLGESMPTKVHPLPKNVETVVGEHTLTRHGNWNASLRLQFRNAEPKWRADRLVPRRLTAYDAAELPRS